MLTKAQLTKLQTAARKARPGGIEKLLLKLEVPKEEWFAPLRWLMREQGSSIGHHWQIAWALANLECPLPIEDAVWLLENLGEQLAFGGSELVLPHASVILPGWHSTLEQIVMRSFAGHLDRLRAVRVHATYRLGILYALAQLGDRLSADEKAEVLAALARSYVTMSGTSAVLIPAADGELVEHSPGFSGEDDDQWAAVVGPFASHDAWTRAIWEAAAACLCDASPERPTVFVDRLLRYASGARPSELGVVIAFGHVDESACEGDRGELARRHLHELDADARAAVREVVREAAELAEREVPREVSDVLAASGAGIAEEIAALVSACGYAGDLRIYVPLRGEPSVNGIAQIAPEIYGLEGTPELDGALMEPLISLDLAELPELQARFGCDALAFFISSRSDNNASEDDSGEVATMRLSIEQARDLGDGTPFRLVPVDVPRAAFDTEPPAALRELAARLRSLPMRVLGPPGFIQGDARSDGFVLQLTEDFIDANFGGGVMYLYEDDGFWQS